MAVVAYLLGRPAWFMTSIGWVHRVTARRPQGSELEVRVAARADPMRIGGVLVAVLVLFLTGIDWIPVAIVGALLALFLWRVALAEQRVGLATPGESGASQGS